MLAPPEAALAPAARPTFIRRIGSLGPAVLGPGIVLAVILFALAVGPLFLPDPNATQLTSARLPPLSDGHLFGTDNVGRDVLARALDGGRVSLLVGLAAVAIGFGIGGTFGMIAGYFGGRVDTVIMRLNDLLLAFPSLVLALTIAAYLGPSTRNVIIAIGFFTIPAHTRLARAATLSLVQRDFVLASKLMGAPAHHVLVRHVAANVFFPLLAYALLVVATSIVTEASLSFLGLGVTPPQASWGVMIADGRAELARAPHVVLLPGALLFATVLSFNLLGDALRSKLRGQ